MLRDGQHQHAVHSGVAPYKPNSLDAGCPFFAGAGDDAFVDVPVTVAAAKKVRANPVSFDDHYSQAGMFWRSMSTVEKEHIMRAYTFELGKCYEQAIKERQLLALANIDPGLCAEVATGLGLPAPEADKTITDEKTRSALSQVGQKWPVDGRVVGIVVDPDGELPGVREVRQAVLTPRWCRC